MDLICKIKKIEAILTKYNTIIEHEAGSLKNEYSIDSSDELEKSIKNINEEDRLLQIGIIGRVKAGKSSLLNALLFKGDNILPKAATPMTAALTELSYGKELSASVSFFSKDDFERIKEDHSKYLNKLSKYKEASFNNLVERSKKKKLFSKPSPSEKKNLNEKALKQALREIKLEKELCAAYDQFEKIKNSKLKIENLDENKKITAGDISELNNSLFEYVGSNGKYMPFTKSVHIKLPQEELMDIKIIDTPGINDPVPSREARTRELLKYCDVNFVVSPSGQFMSNEDTELMDRITKKEGVSEIYIIASQIDNQLYGSVKEEYKGDLKQVLNGITKSLGTHLISTLQKIKLNNPEIGSVFDELIQKGEKGILYSSSICETLTQNFLNKTKLDEATQHAWKNLTTQYPDYFNDNDEKVSYANLNMLGNTTNILKTITSVKSKKNEIINKRQQDFINFKNKSLDEYIDSILTFSENQTNIIKSIDKKELLTQKKSLQNIQKKTSAELNEEYFELVEQLELDMKKVLTTKLNSFFTKTRKNIKNEERTETETYRAKKSGLLHSLSRFIKCGGYETRTRTYTTLRSGAVRNALEDLTYQVEDSIFTEAQQFVLDWKKHLYSNIVKTLRKNVDDDSLDTILIKKTIRTVLNSVEYPEMEYGSLLEKEKKESTPKKTLFRAVLASSLRNKNNGLQARGTLEGSDAEKFLDEALDFISDLKKQVSKDIKSYCKNLITSLKKIDPSEKIFQNYLLRIEELENQLEKREVTLEMFSNLTKELKEVYL